jgi:hypothetical protein
MMESSEGFDDEHVRALLAAGARDLEVRVEDGWRSIEALDIARAVQ